MNWRIIGTLAAKDLSLFFRKKGIVALTIMGLAFYLVIYFVMPSTADEDLEIGVYAPGVPPVFQQLPEEGLEITTVASEEELKDSVTDGTYIVGVSLPSDFFDKLGSGDKPDIHLYFTPDAPPEIKTAALTLVNEFAYLLSGQTLTVAVTEEVLGPDLLGTPVPPRDRLRPLLAVFIIVMEIMGLANLVSQEVERRTAQSLLVTPVTIIDLFIAKGLTGTGLAFGQALLFMAIVGGLSASPLIIIVALLLGALLVTGVAFLVSSISKDFMSVLAWSIPMFIILSVPAFGVLFPGAITVWIKILPSYYLVDTVHRVANFGSGWGDIWLNLVILLGYCAVITFIGIYLIRRRVG